MMDDDDQPPGDGAADDRRTYEVGYGKPPKHGQIKPGEIRNPHKRPKGTRSYKSEIADVLALPVPMTQNGKVKKVSTRRAVQMKLREKALKGDMRSIIRLVEFAMQQDEVAGVVGTTSGLLAEDEQILANARARAGSTEPAVQSLAEPDPLAQDKEPEA